LTFERTHNVGIPAFLMATKPGAHSRRYACSCTCTRVYACVRSCVRSRNLFYRRSAEAAASEFDKRKARYKNRTVKIKIFAAKVSDREIPDTRQRGI